MWQRFTAPARKAVFYTQEEAKRFNTSEIEPEHILLGLLRRDNEATYILTRMGIDVDALRLKVTQLLHPNPEGKSKDCRMTLRSQHVLDFSYDEASELRDNHLGPEHLLLGMLREHEALEGVTPGDLGLTLETAREAVKLYRRPPGESNFTNSPEPNAETENSVIHRIATALLQAAIRDGATEIHIEPSDVAIPVSFVVDGNPVEIMTLPLHIKNFVFDYFKTASGVSIESGIEQTGLMPFQYNAQEYQIEGKFVPKGYGDTLILTFASP